MHLLGSSRRCSENSRHQTAAGDLIKNQNILMKKCIFRASKSILKQSFEEFGVQPHMPKWYTGIGKYPGLENSSRPSSYDISGS